MSALVVDACVVASWFFLDERDGYSLAVARDVEERGAIAPVLWLWEVENTLFQGYRRGRIDEEALLSNLDELRAIPFRFDVPETFGAELALAKRHGLTIYDAAYLELAMRRGTKLATKDAVLVRAAKAEGLYFEPPAEVSEASGEE